MSKTIEIFSIVQIKNSFLLDKVYKCNIGFKNQIVTSNMFQLIVVAYNDDVGPIGHLSLE